MAREQPKPRRIGSETPRLWTPPLRPLTPETTKGFEVIEFAAILGIELLPWQKWLFIHALELLEDGTYRFRTVLLLVARQNGKSLVMQVLSLWRLFMDAARMVIGTAQSLDVSEEQWAAAVSMAQDSEELADLIAHVDHTNGKKALRLIKDAGGGRYKVAAASRKGGRGLSGELILMDELREHTNWDSWGAVTKTTLARPMAQIWAASNAGDAASIVLRFVRNSAHAALGNPDGIEGLDTVTVPEEFAGDDDEQFADSLGLFEWSAPPGMSIWDRNGWAMANPSMNHIMADPTIALTERAIAAAVRTDPPRVVQTEILCQWLETTHDGPYPPGQWEAAADPTSKRVGRYVFGIDVSHDRSTAHIAVAAARADGLLHVELIASRSGTAWVKPWLEERKDNPELSGVVLQANGAPASSLLIDLQAIDGLNVIPWSGAELGKGFGLFYDLVRGFNPDDLEFDVDAPAPVTAPDTVRPPLLRHRNQPPLNLAAGQAAIRPSGDGWLLDRSKSLVDIAPLIAVNAAAWGYYSHPPEPVFRSKYEDEEPLTVSGLY